MTNRPSTVTKMEIFISETSEASVGLRRLLKRLADAASSSAVNYPHIFFDIFVLLQKYTPPQLFIREITMKIFFGILS